ncbi:hypothetical protein YC2023_079615 [Brassica napus]
MKSNESYVVSLALVALMIREVYVFMFDENVPRDLRNEAKELNCNSEEPFQLYDQVLRCNPGAFEYAIPVSSFLSHPIQLVVNLYAMLNLLLHSISGCVCVSQAHTLKLTLYHCRTESLGRML